MSRRTRRLTRRSTGRADTRLQLGACQRGPPVSLIVRPHNMPRTVLHIYAAAVCFVSVACLSIALGIAVYSAIGVFQPAFTAHPVSLLPPPTPSFIVPGMSVDEATVRGPKSAAATSPSDARDEAGRKAAALENGLSNEEIASKQSVLRWGIVALISSLLFFSHWRILRRGA